MKSALCKMLFENRGCFEGDHTCLSAVKLTIDAFTARLGAEEIPYWPTSLAVQDFQTPLSARDRCPIGVTTFDYMAFSPKGESPTV